MTNPTSPTLVPPPPSRGVLRRWLDFWFAAADPTTLGFIRIVTGCLVLYVHLAYTFDLQSFFGKDAWYGLEYVNRERREFPHVHPPADWDEYKRTAQLPEFPHRRKAVSTYMRNLITAKPTRGELDPALAYLDRLQRRQGDETRARYDQNGLAYIMVLSKNPTFRRNQLKAVENQAFQVKEEPLPAVLEGMDPAERKIVAAEMEAFFQTLPRGAVDKDEDQDKDRGYILNHLIEMSPEQRESFVKFLRHLTTLSEKERNEHLDYLDYWNVDKEVVDREGNPTFSIWYHISDPESMAVAHVVMLFIMLLFTLGVFTRVTSVLTWLAAVSYIHRTQQVLFGMDTMMNILLFYCMIGNSGAALSIDRLVNRYRAVNASLARFGTIEPATQEYLNAPPLSVSAGFALRLIQVHFCFIYMASGMSKLKGAAWWNTTAYWDTVANPEFTPIHYTWYEAVLRSIVSSRPAFAVISAIGVGFTIFAEFGLPFLVWSRLRPYIVILGLFLHAGIAVFMGLWIFSLFMMTMLLAYIPGCVIRDRFFGTLPLASRLTLRYNPKDRRQLVIASRAKAVDFEGILDLVPTEGKALRVLTDSKVELSGVPAADLLIERISFLKRFRYLFLIPWLKKLFV